jgi:hypothetical protein
VDFGGGKNCIIFVFYSQQLHFFIPNLEVILLFVLKIVFYSLINKMFEMGKNIFDKAVAAEATKAATKAAAKAATEAPSANTTASDPNADTTAATDSDDTAANADTTAANADTTAANADAPDNIAVTGD